MNRTVLLRSCCERPGVRRTAVVTARGVLSGEQPVGFFRADLGAYVVADVEHAPGTLALGMRCVAMPVARHLNPGVPGS